MKQSKRRVNSGDRSPFAAVLDFLRAIFVLWAGAQLTLQTPLPKIDRQ